MEHVVFVKGGRVGLRASPSIPATMIERDRDEVLVAFRTRLGLLRSAWVPMSDLQPLKD